MFNIQYETLGGRARRDSEVFGPGTVGRLHQHPQVSQWQLEVLQGLDKVILCDGPELRGSGEGDLGYVDDLLTRVLNVGPGGGGPHDNTGPGDTSYRLKESRQSWLRLSRVSSSCLL